MYDAITDVHGVEVGQAQDLSSLTGCTVVLCREGAAVGVDVRGAAPATRETDLCRPGTLVERAQAIFLTGGSAFGLDAASGVMRYLWERGLGFPTRVVAVPIVPGAAIFDLGVGKVAWPDPEMAYAACTAATAGQVERGCVGAGTGASVGHLLGLAGAMKSGVGTASLRVGEATVGAIMVVNAVGDVVQPEDGRILAGSLDPSTGQLVGTARAILQGGEASGSPLTHTTIGVVATDAALTADQVNQLATVAHDGLARAIRPVHTMFDGDTVFSLATAAGPEAELQDMVALAAAAVDVVERAVVDGVMAATAAGGLPSARDVQGE